MLRQSCRPKAGIRLSTAPVDQQTWTAGLHGACCAEPAGTPTVKTVPKANVSAMITPAILCIIPDPRDNGFQPIINHNTTWPLFSRKTIAFR